MYSIFKNNLDYCYHTKIFIQRTIRKDSFGLLSILFFKDKMQDKTHTWTCVCTRIASILFIKNKIESF